MASALVNKVGRQAADGFLDLPPSAAPISCGWLSPTISFGRESNGGDRHPDPPAAATAAAVLEKPASTAAERRTSSPLSAGMAGEIADGKTLSRNVATEFEFLRLDEPAAMLPADELFFDGKLVPLQVASIRPPPSEAATSSCPTGSEEEPPSLELLGGADAAGSDPYMAFSPKAPRCSSRWRELLGLKKAEQNGSNATAMLDIGNSSSSSSRSASGLSSPSSRSLKRLLQRNRRSCPVDSPLRWPLLRDPDGDPVSAVSSRLSLSSSSSGRDPEDLPRLSLDSDKAVRASISLGRNPPRVRLSPKLTSAVNLSSGPYIHHNPPSTPGGAAGAGGRAGSSPMQRVPEDSVPIPARSTSAESPRMNSSGKVVFHGLGRSSSSPSTFSGGSRVKHRGVERSYSANVVRVSPVLNVPVCSLRGSSRAGSVFGFSQLFSPQKKETTAAFSSQGASRSGAVAGRSVRIEKPS